MIISIASVLGVFLLMTGWFYFTCPVYIFEEPKPFTGQQFYNPYQNMVDDAWKKGVFHLHTKSWMGLSNGDNTYEEVMDVYQQLHYDIVAISDYMSINRSRSIDIPYIPAYEHGYNIKKVHQSALGASKVLWRDYFFKQNLHQKQHVIDLLKKNSHLVAVNHPGMRSSYPPDDFNFLSGYDLFEVQNGTHLSEAAWDAALSSGYPAWLIANDDSHTVNNPARVQREVTFINAPSSSDREILNRLAQGASFGVRFPRKKQSTMDEKRKDADAISFPAEIQIAGDTLRVGWRQIMQQIEFIGDRGIVLKTVTDSDTARYHIRPEDSYVRVKLTSSDSLVYYLNPVVRFSDDNPVKQRLSQIDKVKTFRKRAVIAFVIGVIVLLSIFGRTKRFFARR